MLTNASNAYYIEHRVVQYGSKWGTLLATHGPYAAPTPRAALDAFPYILDSDREYLRVRRAAA